MATMSDRRDRPDHRGLVEALLGKRPDGFPAAEQVLERAAVWLSLLFRWNDRVNLTSIGDPLEAAERLFWEAAPALTYLDDRPLLDIGSGAGFPGVALKILRPRLPVTLLEPRRKRAIFLREAIDACGLEGIEVREERLEEHSKSGHRYNYFTWRALRISLDDLDALVADLPPVRLLVWTTVEGGRRIEAMEGRAWDTLHWIRLHPSRDRVVLVAEHLEPDGEATTP